ncbi:CHAP domain-containing protein [Cronobacter sakazakii]|uniref:CHAP domain-containing protein n=1 Tax=Cronobacter sakazakii TaxID=28141 RepID=UPI000CFBBA24|nr:CHAP domain-containing protein [Cronobacter sakazakii]
MSVLPAITFPVPSDGQGKAFNSQEEILSHLDGENSGPYLVGTQGMWHGGIHITDLTTPWCALSGNNSSEVQYVAGNPCKGEQPVRCMADGEIIAYRVCKDYESIKWHGSPLFFSCSFVLVRHYVQPGEKKESGLTFFTLYMNMAPYSAYRQNDENERVTASALTCYASADDVKAGKKAGSLPAGCHITLENEVITASRNQQIRQYSRVTLVKVPEGSSLATGTSVWVVSDRNNLKLASGTAETPSWWANCTPAYRPSCSSLARYRTAKNWRYYLSRDNVLANQSAGTLPAGFPVSADLDNAALQVVRSSDSHTFSLVTLGQGAGKEAKGNRVWVVSDADSLIPENDAASNKQPDFDKVVSLSTPVRIKAGDSIGHLGFFELPTDDGKLSRYQVHIECLSTDDNLENFLTNPEKVGEDDPVCLKYDKDVPLMVPDAQGVMVDAQRNTRAPGRVEMSQVSAVDLDGHSVTDKKRAAYYEIEPEAGWLTAEKAEKISRYDLAALGFTTLKSTTDNFDLIDGIHHPAGVVKGILEQLYVAAQAETRSAYALNAFNYRRLLEQADSNRDGFYSEEEYVQAIHNPSYRNQLFRLIVKHPGEWYYSKDDAPWKNYLDSLGEDAQAWRDYTEAFLDKIVWMKQVPEMVAEPWHMHPVMFLGALRVELNCARLIWGQIVDNVHGKEKGCRFRKKTLQICTELWGRENSTDYADVLMGCISVETSRMFSSSVIGYREAKDKNGDVILVHGPNGPRPKIELHAYSNSEINSNEDLISNHAVGLIQFTQSAVNQINQTHGCNITKKELALMDEIEQLEYVKLYFTSNKDKFDLIKKPDDVYTYIFCPEGVGKPDDAALYSLRDNQRSYNNNISLDTTVNGNHGNNDGIIQKSELLSRLHALMNEGEVYRNQCTCLKKYKTGPGWMPIAMQEYQTYKAFIETDSVLNDRIKIYHNTTNARGNDGSTSWCSSFVNWCMIQSGYSYCATNSALANSWSSISWQDGEQVDKPFYGAIVVMNYSHVAFVYGINKRGRLLLLGGNQGGGRSGTANCLSIRPNSLSNVSYIMKPKGYEISDDDYNLQVIDMDAPELNFSSTH